MQRTASSLSRDPEADALATNMVEKTDLMATIVRETVEEGTESGRTACGKASSVRGPLARFPESIELAQCPRSVGGAWHTHPSNLQSPVNSLPDIANVMFGELDVSIVVGTQSADVVVAGADSDTMVREFQDAIGFEAGRPGDVVRGITSGEVTNPVDARQRVRSRLRPLFSQRSLRLPVDVPHSVTATTTRCPDMAFHARFYHPGHANGGIRVPDGALAKASAHSKMEFQDKARERSDTVKKMVGTQAKSMFDVAYRTAVSSLVRGAIFSE